MYPNGSNKYEVLGTYYDNGTVSSSKYIFRGFNDSDSHRFRDGKPVDGGPWCMFKEEITTTWGKPLRVYVNNSSFHYGGGFRIPINYRQSFSPNSAWYNRTGAQALINSLNLRGAEAWAKCRPDLPDFSLATEIMELRDLPSMFKKQLLRVRRLAWREYRKRHPRAKRYTSDYAQYHLELQFGWLPILSSILKYREVLKKKDRLLKQKIRDAGRPIRRRRELSEPSTAFRDTSYKASFGNGWGPEHEPILNTNCYSGSSSHKEGRDHSSIKTWAVARMRYYLPRGPRDIRWRERLWRRMRGGMITTDLVYNAMPWTWLADYFTDLGHFVQATSGGVGDRLAADYCYLMRTIVYKYESSARLGLRKKGGGTQYSYPTRTHTFTWKIRVEATPFGFGFRQSDLSPMQLTILGALGLSKL